MQLSDFFEPIQQPKATVQFMPEADAMMSQIVYGLADGCSNAEIRKFDIAIVGISDDKNAPENQGCKEAADAIRSCLAGLRKTPKSVNIIDLGNIKGKNLNDRYFALGEVIEILTSCGVCSLIIGGGQDYVLPLTKAMAKTSNELSLAIVDAKIDFCVNGNDFSSHTFLSQLAEECNASIFELNLLGVQKYLIGESQECKMTELDWEYTRLNALRHRYIASAEPFLRDANLVSFDVGAIRQDCMPYFSNMNVNGFSGIEACQLAWYIGLGTQLKAFCLQEYNPTLDITGKGRMLCAEIIWHFIDGMSQNMRDVPEEDAIGYKISVVHLQDFAVDIRFYSNRVSKRWWIEVPWKKGVKMLACDKRDYLLAQSGELPDKWWKFFKKQNNE